MSTRRGSLGWWPAGAFRTSIGHARIPGMRGHVVMVGLGSVGMQVLDGLLTRGRDVVVVERDETNRYLNQVRHRGVPLVLGDSALGQTLDSVNLSSASSVAIVTSDDLTNIETGLAVRDRLGPRWAEVPVVLRVFDREHRQPSLPVGQAARRRGGRPGGGLDA